MSQNKNNRTNEQIINEAEAMACRFTENHIDAMHRQAMINTLLARGLDEVFDVSRIRMTRNPELQAVKNHYGSKPRIFFTENPVQLPMTYRTKLSNSCFVVRTAFPAPEYRLYTYVDLIENQLYKNSTCNKQIRNTSASTLLNDAIMKLKCLHVLEDALDERPHTCHLTLSFGVVRKVAAQMVLAATNQLITDKMGIERVIIHGVPNKLAATLVKKQNIAYSESLSWVACAALIN